jgi:hypothetical protein
VLVLVVVSGGFYLESQNNELRALVKHNDFNERMSVIEAKISDFNLRVTQDEYHIRDNSGHISTDESRILQNELKILD